MTTDMRIAVILPAAGQGSRFGAEAGRSKLEAEVGGRAVLVRAVELFVRRPQVKQIIVAVDPDKLSEFKFKWGDKLGFMGAATIVPGGKTDRWETVLNALNAVEPSITHVAVHDAARPVTDAAMIDRVFEAAKHFPAVIPAVPVSATLKRIDPSPVRPPQEHDPADAILGSAGKTTIEAYAVEATVPRDRLWMVQTPQVFERSLLERAYRQISDGKVTGANVTDDAMLVEALGERVVAVAGDALNVKITQPQDVAFAEAVASMRGLKGATKDALGPKRKFPTWAESEEER